MPGTIVAIVEGHADERALPELLRQLVPEVAIPRPIRMAKSQMLHRESEFERYLALAAVLKTPRSD
ncbi:MAG: hypothetical protein R2729_05405 [Bryobacteraceae bacterium]